MPLNNTSLKGRVFAVLLAAVLVAAGCGGDDDKAVTPKPTTSTTSSTTSTTSTTTTTVVPLPDAIAPLTGVKVTPEMTPRMARPALAIKIDNSAAAMPQSGLNDADIVFEIKVEGISRLMAVFHSNDSAEVGPTRSARYSDPPILALLGKPLFGWSGANEGVTRDVLRSEWVFNVHWDKAPNAYQRKRGRSAPHNLFTSTANLFPLAKPEQGIPLQQFQYLAEGESNAGAYPVPGMREKVGDTPSAWVWDAATSQWLRWQYGKRDNTNAGQAAAQNVVTLEIEYKGGSKTPTAKTVGSGRAIVLVGGTVVEGTWSRNSQLEPLFLTGTDGQPIKLTPGRTWIELTQGATSQILDADAAAAMLAS